MKCTSCKQGSLQPSYLDALFPSHECDHCGGQLVFIQDYLRWMESSPSVPAATGIEVSASETSNAMLCPKTGTIMLKYRIAHDLEHKLDLSPSINAIWLDKGEWELLKAEGLALELNAIFTDSWQTKIRQAQTKETLEALYTQQWGQDYEAIKAFKEQFSSMPHQNEIIAYLLASDPYKV